MKGENCTLYIINSTIEDKRPVPQCFDTNCGTCGWNRAEMQRRNAQLKKKGLSQLPNGCKGLVVKYYRPDEVCACCGRYVPEGMTICPICAAQAEEETQ